MISACLCIPLYSKWSIFHQQVEQRKYSALLAGWRGTKKFVKNLVEDSFLMDLKFFPSIHSIRVNFIICHVWRNVQPKLNFPEAVLPPLQPPSPVSIHPTSIKRRGKSFPPTTPPRLAVFKFFYWISPLPPLKCWAAENFLLVTSLNHSPGNLVRIFGAFSDATASSSHALPSRSLATEKVSIHPFHSLLSDLHVHLPLQRF